MQQVGQSRFTKQIHILHAGTKRRWPQIHDEGGGGSWGVLGAFKRPERSVAAAATAYPGKAVQHIGHDHGLPQHEQQRWQHSREQRPGHILLRAVPGPVVLAALAAHCHCYVGNNTCRTTVTWKQHSVSSMQMVIMTGHAVCASVLDVTTCIMIRGHHCGQFGSVQHRLHTHTHTHTVTHMRAHTHTHIPLHTQSPHTHTHTQTPTHTKPTHTHTHIHRHTHTLQLPWDAHL